MPNVIQTDVKTIARSILVKQPPLLTSFSLVADHLTTLEAFHLHPSSSISQLTLDYAMSVDECIHVLASSSGLQDVVFIGVGSFPLEVREQPSARIVLPNLSRLVIDSADDLSDLFYQFSMPSLRDLSLGFTEGLPGWSDTRDSVFSMLEQSKARLDTLRFAGHIQDGSWVGELDVGEMSLLKVKDYDVHPEEEQIAMFDEMRSLCMRKGAGLEIRYINSNGVHPEALIRHGGSLVQVEGASEVIFQSQ